MKHKQIDPRITAERAARQQQGLIDHAKKITLSKYQGSKKKKTLKFLSHRLNKQVVGFMSGYNG